jgi:hypothetical protein
VVEVPGKVGMTVMSAVVGGSVVIAVNTSNGRATSHHSVGHLKKEKLLLFSIHFDISI